MITQFTIKELENKLIIIKRLLKIKSDQASLILTEIEKLCNEIILIENNIKQMNDQGEIK